MLCFSMSQYIFDHHEIDVLCLTETWLKPDEYIILNESAHKIVTKMSHVQKAKGEVLLQFITILSVFLRRQA